MSPTRRQRSFDDTLREVGRRRMRQRARVPRPAFSSVSSPTRTVVAPPSSPATAATPSQAPPSSIGQPSTTDAAPTP